MPQADLMKRFTKIPFKTGLRLADIRIRAETNCQCVADQLRRALTPWTASALDNPDFVFILLLLPVVLLLEDAGPKEKLFLIISYIALNSFLLSGWVRFFPQVWILAALFFVEGREYWRSFSPKLAAAGLAAAIVIAAVDAQSHEARYLLEPGRRFQRVALDRATYSSTFPAVSSAGLFLSGNGSKWVCPSLVARRTDGGIRFRRPGLSSRGTVVRWSNLL